MIHMTSTTGASLTVLLSLSLSACVSNISSDIATDAKPDVGCLRSSLDSCLKRIRPHIAAEDYHAAIDSITRNATVDVNGKKVNKDSTFAVSLNDNTESERGKLVITAKYSENNIITEVRLHIDGMIHYAETDDEYNKLGLYDGIRLAVGNECKELSTPHTFYKFFHNSIKSRLGTIDKLSNLSEIHASTTFSQETPYISFCNSKAQYYEMVGDDTNDISSNNPSGTFGYYTLIIK